MASRSAKAGWKRDYSSSAALDEKSILERAVCHRDKCAAAILYAKYLAETRHYIISHIGPVPDVDDLAEEAFVRLCKGPSPL
jgi:DNA-directed RNA polymerase specialized sigma24 family protein